MHRTISQTRDPQTRDTAKIAGSQQRPRSNADGASAKIAVVSGVVTIVAFAYVVLFGPRNFTDLVKSLRAGRAKNARPNATHTERTRPAVWVPRLDLLEELTVKLRKYRVVVIEGERGVGKTSLLSTEAEPILREYGQRSDGELRWVSLKHGTFDSDQFFDAVSHTCGFEAVAASPSLQKPVVLRRLLHSRRVLLVVDNFESVAPPHPGVVEFLNDLPDGVNCVVTSSRAIPSLRGAATVCVRGFTADQTRDYLEQKLRQRDLAAMPDAQVIRDIHRLTGGVPLALEWVLGRVRVGIPLRDAIASIEQGQTDIFSALFDASWRELTDFERRALEVASLLPRPVPVKVLTHFGGRGAPEELVGVLHRNLATLPEAHAEPDAPLMAVHPLAHKYAAGKLARVPTRTRAGYVRAASLFFRDLFSAVAEGGATPSPRVVDRQIENGLSLARLCSAHGLQREYVDLVLAIRGSLLTSGRITERAEVCAAAAKAAGVLGDTAAELRLATASGAALGLLGRHGESESSLSQVAARAEAAGYVGQAARARRAWAASAYRDGRTGEAGQVLGPARHWAAGSNDQCAVIDIDYLSANVAYVERRFADAGDICHRILSEAGPAKYPRAAAYALEQLSALSLEQGDVKTAVNQAVDARRIAEEHVDRRQSARADLALAKALMAGRHPRSARKRAAAAALVFAEVGLRHEEREARAVVDHCTGPRNTLSVLLRRSKPESSMLHLPLGGD